MRSCGDCGKCCQLLGVPGVTEMNERCQHWCRGSGCAIYKKRPQPCRNFNCAWKISDAMPEYMRPDKTGVVVWHTSDIPHRLVINVDPKKPKALERPDIKIVIDEWMKKPDNVVVTTIGDQTQIISVLPLSRAQREELLNGRP